MIAEFLTELDLRHVTVVCNDPFPFGALSKRRVPDDVFMTWIHPLRHNRKVGQFHRSVHGSGHDDRCPLKHRPMEVPACQAHRWRCTNARRSAAR